MAKPDRFFRAPLALLFVGLVTLAPGLLRINGMADYPESLLKAKLEVVLGAIVILTAAVLLRHDIRRGHPSETYPRD